MSLVTRGAVVLLAASTVTHCASVPRDAGFSDVRRTVEAETRQSVDWQPQLAIEEPDDGAVAVSLGETMTADRAVQIAFAHNRDLQATLEELGIARSELIAASTIGNPLIDAETRFAAPKNPFEIGISKTLMDVFNLRHRKKLGRAQFENAKLRVGGAIIHFAAQVRLRYYELLAARKVLALQVTITKAQEAAAELALRQHAAGNISDLDLETDQAGYEQVKLDHARAQLDELQARERLIADLGLAKLTDLPLPDDFDAPSDTEMEVGEIERQALSRRLDIRMLQQEVDAARAGVSVAKTAAFDELSVGVHQEREADGANTAGPAVSVPLPIFDRGAAQKERARALLRQAQQRLAAMKVTARSEARSAHERLTEALARLTYTRDVVIPRRDRILKLTQLEYNAMLRSVFQILEARQSLAQAKRDEIVAVRDYWVARTELETALLGVSRFSVRPEGLEPSSSGQSGRKERQDVKQKH
jgi:cobalt-zinc-cadmium efflux system outer membrane protein